VQELTRGCGGKGSLIPRGYEMSYNRVLVETVLFVVLLVLVAIQGEIPVMQPTN